MYTTQDRELLLKQIVNFMQGSPVFEGLLQIGSGAVGFTDIYSDIDLMAGCYDAGAVATVNQQLQQFLSELGACHIEKRSWTATALGISVYFENGLSADVSFMPTPELPIRSPQHKVLFSKSERFADTVCACANRLAKQPGRYGVNDSIHYRFVNELRYVEIALLRGQFIFADIALCNARQLLLAIETVAEGKKLHQFKAYNTLDKPFLARLETTYPADRGFQDIHIAKENLLALYFDTVHQCGFLEMDPSVLKLLGRFE